MSRSVIQKNPTKPPRICADWLILAIYEVVHRSPIRIKEIVYRLNNEYDMPIAQRSLERMTVRPCKVKGSDHLCMHPTFYVPLTKAAENTYLFDEFERQIGRTVPVVAKPAQGPIEMICLDMLSQAGTLVTEATEALKQAPLSKPVLKDLRPHISDMRQNLDTMDQAVSFVLSGRVA